MAAVTRFCTRRRMACATGWRTPWLGNPPVRRTGRSARSSRAWPRCTDPAATRCGKAGHAVPSGPFPAALRARRPKRRAGLPRPSHRRCCPMRMRQTSAGASRSPGASGPGRYLARRPAPAVLLPSCCRHRHGPRSWTCGQCGAMPDRAGYLLDRLRPSRRRGRDGGRTGCRPAACPPNVRARRPRARPGRAARGAAPRAP